MLTMGVAERRAREKTELRQDILDAAREIFVAEGYDALTMRGVARRIEYSPTTIYLYFKDKSELIQAICDESFGKLIARLEELAGKHTDPLDYLEAGLRAYVDFGLKHPSHYYATFIANVSNQQSSTGISFGRTADFHQHDRGCSGGGTVHGRGGSRYGPDRGSGGRPGRDAARISGDN